jgi:hypothetical protein
VEGELQVAVIPGGSVEVIVAEDPIAPGATETPGISVAETVVEPVPMEVIEIGDGVAI